MGQLKKYKVIYNRFLKAVYRSGPGHFFLKSVSLFFFFFHLVSAFSQDIHFSQYFSAPLFLNPGLTGQFDGNFRLSTNYKNQWSSVSNYPFETIAVSTDMPFVRKKLSGGILFFKDKAGDSKMGISQISLSLGSGISINETNILSAGLQGGWAQRSIDISNLTWDSQYDGKTFNKSLFSGENSPPGNFHYFDISAGAYYKGFINENLEIDVGCAGAHLNNPPMTFNGNGEILHSRWTLHGSADFGLKNRDISFIPSFLAMQQGPASEVNIGGALKFRLGIDSKYTGINVSSNLTIGGFLRLKDAFIVYTRYDFKNFLSAGFSYDINLSNLRTATGARGGTEVFLQFRMRKSDGMVQTGEKI